MLRIFLSILVLCTCMCCKSQSKVMQKNMTDATIELNKTTCYGKCPAFTILIHSNGDATYIGEANVSKVGKFTKHFTQEEMQTLFSTFENAGFDSFKEEYPDKSKDMSVSTLSYTQNGKTKQVKGTYRAPKTLKALVKQVSVLSETEGWKKAE